MLEAKTFRQRAISDIINKGIKAGHTPKVIATEIMLNGFTGKMETMDDFSEYELDWIVKMEVVLTIASINEAPFYMVLEEVFRSDDGERYADVLYSESQRAEYGRPAELIEPKAMIVKLSDVSV